MPLPSRLRSYAFPALLFASILFGGWFGYLFGAKSLVLKPLGDIFLNLIFTCIVPLVFFSVSSAITRMGSSHSFGRLVSRMGLVFLFTSSIAAIYALIVVHYFPPAQGVELALPGTYNMPVPNLGNQLVGMFTVHRFADLFSHEHMLALMAFAVLVGIAVGKLGDGQKQRIHLLLQDGEVLFMRLFNLIMYYAPIGFFAYFAVLVHELGPQVMGQYARVTCLYYLSASLYFVLSSSAYAYLAARMAGLRIFWQHISIPMFTSLATCSSAASIPANLAASKSMRVTGDIADTVIPLGSLLHKDGSVIGGVFKIAFLFGLFQLDFTGASVLLVAFGVALLVGTVMGAFPSGGMLGELLILNVYGFSPSALIAIAAISILIDPLATMLNVTCNTSSSMLIARLMLGRNWQKRAKFDTKTPGIEA